jgi:hypothetical protein
MERRTPHRRVEQSRLPDLPRSKLGNRKLRNLPCRRRSARYHEQGQTTQSRQKLAQTPRHAYATAICASPRQRRNPSAPAAAPRMAGRIPAGWYRPIFVRAVASVPGTYTTQTSIPPMPWELPGNNSITYPVEVHSHGLLVPSKPDSGSGMRTTHYGWRRWSASMERAPANCLDHRHLRNRKSEIVNSLSILPESKSRPALTSPRTCPDLHNAPRP